MILHIDMNSYFATVEQQCNPFLRGKPIAIGGSHGTRSIVVAASIEAKKYGVKTGMNHIEAKQCCPFIQFIEGDHEKYLALTQKLINIGQRYTDRLEVYSVDELFLDLNGWVFSYRQAIVMAQRLKSDLTKEIGDYLTCSVGIAPNKMMAKVASSMQKPDGLTVYQEKDIPQVLKWLELTDIPGIGHRLQIRLFDQGIRTLEQLGKFPLSQLQAVFGLNNGIHLSNMGRGIDYSQVPYVHETKPAKSMGHNYTLPHDIKNRDQVYAYLLSLAEKVGRRLRRNQYQGRQVWVLLRWDDFTFSHQGKTLKHYIDAGVQIYLVAKEMLENWPFYKAVRLIGVGVSLLIQKGKQLPILKESQKLDRLVYAQDTINDRYGERTIQRARSLAINLRRKVGGFSSGIRSGLDEKEL